jgi:HprK-related kinase B
MNTDNLSRQALVDEMRNAYPINNELYLNFESCTIAVASNQKEVIEALKAYYKPFIASSQDAEIFITAHETTPTELPVAYTVKQPDPGKTKIKEEYVELADGRIVRKRLTGMVFIFGEGENVAVGPCLKNINQVVNFINNRHIEWMLCRGGILGHAAGVILNGKGLAMAGFSGAGKSTLALHLMNQGGVFVSNDRLMIEKDGSELMMHGVAKMPRINPGTALHNPKLRIIMTPEEQARFSALSEKELWELEHKYDAPIEHCYGPNRFVLSTPMKGLVLLNWKRGDQPLEIEKINLNKRRDLLPAFMKSVGLFFRPHGTCTMPDPNEDTYIEFLSGCDVWEFRGGVDFEAATRKCMTL